MEVPENSVIVEEEDAKCERTVFMSKEQDRKRNSGVGRADSLEEDDKYVKSSCNVKDNLKNNSSKYQNNCEEESDNEILNELQYNCESEEDFDIPTEENFLKSSTSVSGDDETMEQSFGRPRSVHFEDEKWEEGKYKVKEQIEYINSWGDVTNQQESHPFARIERDFEVNGELPFSGSSRLQNIKSANRESVREILRRKREEASEYYDQDNRRRLSNERKSEASIPHLPHERKQSRSRERQQKDLNINNRGSDGRTRNTSNIINGVDSDKKEHMSRSRSPKSENRYTKGVTLMPVNGIENGDGIVISRKDYVMFKSLISSRNTASEKATKEHRKATGKMKKLLPSKSGSQKRIGESPYDPFSAAELQMQALMGSSTSSTKKGSSLGAAALGTGVSLADSARMNATGRESPDFEFSIGFADLDKSECNSREGSPEIELRENRINKGCSGLGSSLTNLDLELAKIGSPSLRRSSEGKRSWQSSVNKSLSVGSASPVLRKPSWSTRDTTSQEVSKWSSPTRDSLSREGLSPDYNKWSSTRDNNSRDNTSPDNHWPLANHDAQSASTPLQDTHNASPSAQDTRSWSSLLCDSHNLYSPTKNNHTWSSSTLGICNSLSPARDTRDWPSPSRETCSESSPSRATGSCRSSPIRDTPSISSPTHENISRSSPVRDTPTAATPSSPTTKTTTARWDISNSTAISGWGADSSSGHVSQGSSYSRYAGNTSVSAQSNPSSIESNGFPEKALYRTSNNTGFETFRASHSSLDTDETLRKKGLDR
nr:uncharacterized protein LOC128685476 [Cherax quadricarinatus]